MRRLSQVVFGCVWLVAYCSFAAEAAGPKATLVGWTEHGAAWNLDQTLQIYHAQGDKETSFARSMAEQALAQMQLQKAVRDKWGRDAEAAVAGTMANDTLDDDNAASEKIDGDHATITFKEEAHLETLYLIKIGDQWKIDVGAFVREFGDQCQAVQRNLQQTARIAQTALNELKENKYKDNDDLVSHLKAEYDKVNSAN